MSATRDTDSDQAKLWNGRSGRAWVDLQEALDGLFEPFERVLVDAVVAASACQVLDIGCGTGATTLAIARRIDPKGSCVGLDISERMLATARGRAERESVSATFICADAQTYAFEPATLDMIVSRFGVMFFDDPVRAFANLRRATRDNGELRFIAWRSPADNPFMTAAERAAAPLLPNLPPRRPDAPGQFAFADADRVKRILQEAGWSGVDIQPLDVDCVLSEKTLDLYVTRLGPVGAILENAEQETRLRVTDRVRGAFAPYIRGGNAQFSAACWTVGARALR